MTDIIELYGNLQNLVSNRAKEIWIGRLLNKTEVPVRILDEANLEGGMFDMLMADRSSISQFITELKHKAYHSRALDRLNEYKDLMEKVRVCQQEMHNTDYRIFCLYETSGLFIEAAHFAQYIGRTDMEEIYLFMDKAVHGNMSQRRSRSNNLVIFPQEASSAA